jgi:hypothetical protein
MNPSRLSIPAVFVCRCEAGAVSGFGAAAVSVRGGLDAQAIVPTSAARRRNLFLRAIEQEDVGKR